MFELFFTKASTENDDSPLWSRQNWRKEVFEPTAVSYRHAFRAERYLSKEDRIVTNKLALLSLVCRLLDSVGTDSQVKEQEDFQRYYLGNNMFEQVLSDPDVHAVYQVIYRTFPGIFKQGEADGRGQFRVLLQGGQESHSMEQAVQ